MAAHQALPSLGFSRQEHWSGLPFPSPMHESEKWKWSSLNCVRLFTTPWTAAYQAPPSMAFSRQEYWSGVPLPSPILYTNNEKTKREKQISCINAYICSNIYIGEGNGKPLQYSCLENAMDGRTWVSAVHGVTQSQARLKWLSRSNVYH